MTLPRLKPGVSVASELVSDGLGSLDLSREVIKDINVGADVPVRPGADTEVGPYVFLL